MTTLEKYEAVNETNSTTELLQVVTELLFEAGTEKQYRDIIIEAIVNFQENPKRYANTLTRKYGIRQQALMLNHYNYGI